MSITTSQQSFSALSSITQSDVICVLGEYTFLRLDNGDEAFYHNGCWITGADASCNEPSVFALAQRIARAGCKSLRCVELPVPNDEEWNWNDIITKLVHASFTRQIRGEIIMTLSNTLRCGRGVHFCSDPLLSGINNNLWFPLNGAEDLHAGIERILTMNGIAENVVRLDLLRDCHEYADYKVIYNRKISG